MADIFTKKKRSEVMSLIRSKNTRQELAVFRELRKRGIYFKRHYKLAPGFPDIAIPSRKVAVFIDGDFWHGWQYPRWRCELPRIYWRRKIENNRKRDLNNFALLRRRGWKVLRIWEHQLRENFHRSIELIAEALS